MRQKPFSAYELAERYTGTKETAGQFDNPQIMAWLRLDAGWPGSDEVAWCSAFCNAIAQSMRLPRSKSLRARSWLEVGLPIPLSQAEPGFDVVILKRGGGNQPGPEVLEAQGHVGFFAGVEPGVVLVLGGNQGNAVSIARFPIDQILGIRRLA